MCRFCGFDWATDRYPYGFDCCAAAESAVLGVVENSYPGCPIKSLDEARKVYAAVRLGGEGFIPGTERGDNTALRAFALMARVSQLA